MATNLLCGCRQKYAFGGFHCIWKVCILDDYHHHCTGRSLIDKSCIIFFCFFSLGSVVVDADLRHLDSRDYYSSR